MLGVWRLNKNIFKDYFYKDFMSEHDQKVKLENDSVIINGIVVEDINTYKILKDISQDKRDDFIKKAIIIGAIGLKNLYKNSL